MAVKASAAITLSCVVDVYSTTRYYLLQASTQARPAKPTTNPPGDAWDDTEPGYTAGSTNTLYFTDLTVFSDGTWAYSSVSVSSSYEAAKQAYNEARSASQAVTALDNSLTQQEIFNRLTNSGAAQGMFLLNGQLYVNASYINTGTLIATLIHGGTLTLGGANDVNGVMRVLDADGSTVVSEIDSDGVQINRGSIISYDANSVTRAIVNSGLIGIQAPDWQNIWSDVAVLRYANGASALDCTGNLGISSNGAVTISVPVTPPRLGTSQISMTNQQVKIEVQGGFEGPSITLEIGTNAQKKVTIDGDLTVSGSAAGPNGNYLSRGDVVNNLNSSDPFKALSASMGRALTVEYITDEYTSILDAINAFREMKAFPFTVQKAGSSTYSDCPINRKTAEWSLLCYGTALRLTALLTIFSGGGSDNGRSFIANVFSGSYIYNFASIS